MTKLEKQAGKKERGIKRERDGSELKCPGEHRSRVAVRLGRKAKHCSNPAMSWREKNLCPCACDIMCRADRELSIIPSPLFFLILISSPPRNERKDYPSIHPYIHTYVKRGIHSA